MAREQLTIALPKGKLLNPCVRLLQKVNLPWEGLLDDTRLLVFNYDTLDKFDIRYIICRPTDIPTFVEYGAADLGIVGKDTIVEENKDVYELVDLKFGYCKFVVAVPVNEAAKQEALSNFSLVRVASKFPRVAEEFFKKKGIQVEVIKLHGNVELAPEVGLSEMIVDLVSTGRTLRENNLVVLEEIFPATARLIANRVSYRMKSEIIQPIQEEMKEVADKEDLES